MKTKNLLLIVVAVLIWFTSNAQSTWQWAVRGGGSSTDSQLTPDEMVKDIKTDALGNVYACGRIRTFADFSGVPVTTFGTSGYCMFLAKYDCAGNLIWVKTMGGQTPLNFANSLALDSYGNIYLTGKLNAGSLQPTTFIDTVINVSSSDMFIAKFDTAGNFKWINVASPGTPNLNSQGLKIVIDNNGLPNLLTWVAGPGELFPGYNVVHSNYVARFDTSGNCTDVFLVTSGTLVPDHKIGINSNSDIFVIGRFREDTLTIGNNDTILYKITTGPSSTEIYIAKFDYNGAFQWAKHFGNPDPTGILATGIDFYNNVFLFTGTGKHQLVVGNDTLVNNISQNFAFPFVSIIDTDGNILWTISANNQYYNAPTAGINVVDHYAYISGFYGGQAVYGSLSFPSSNGIKDIFLAEIDLQNQAFTNAVNISGTGSYEEPQSITSDIQGNVYIGGGFDGTMTVGSSTVTSAGGKTDAFIAKWGTSNCITSIEEVTANLPSNQLFLFPNPAKDVINVFANGLKGNLTVIIYNSIGQSIKKSEIIIDKSPVEIKLNNYSEGIYFIELTNGKERKSGKILIVR